MDLSERLDAWVREGLITRSEADGIAAFEAHPGRISDRTAASPGTAAQVGRASASEGLAYLGVALGIAAIGTLLGRVWGDLSTPARIAIPAVAAVALFVLGWRLRDAAPGPLERLSSISWFFCTAALGWAAAVTVGDGLGLQERATFLAIGGVVVLSAGALYFVRPVTILHWPCSRVRCSSRSGSVGERRRGSGGSSGSSGLDGSCSARGTSSSTHPPRSRWERWWCSSAAR